MLFERFEDEGLAQYSYAVGDEQEGEIAIVDPRRDIDVYLDFAHDRGVAITHVLETHIHADFCSGARELAEKTGAELHLSAYDEGEDYEVAFGHREMREGDRLEVGTAVLEALHTPGHTPEHLSFSVYDTERSAEQPMLLLSGDFLFVGSLGRPDLLGEEAKRELAGRLYDSVRHQLDPLPDGLEVHPGHGAGSMCGSGMGGRPMSTLGFERLANPYLDPELGKDAFIDKILGEAPPFPDYYKRMKRVNSEGPPILDGLPGRRPIAVDELRRRVEKEGHLVIDLRDHLAFGGGHIPGSLGIGLGPNLSTWAGWVVPYDRPLLLVSEHPEQVEEAVRALVRVGLDDVAGYLDGGIEAWREAGHRFQELRQLTPPELAERLESGHGKIRVLDVRTDEEWRNGHIEGAVHIMGGELPDRLAEVPDGPLAVVCGSGYRSTVAASVLQRNGFDNLINVTGGMGAWEKAGLPAVRE